MTLITTLQRLAGRMTERARRRRVLRRLRGRDPHLYK